MSMRKNGQIAQRSTILRIIFGNFTKVIFRIGSIRYKENETWYLLQTEFVYKLPHELPNDVSVRILKY